MKPFCYLPHTADAKFQAFGASFEEALKNAALATMNLITDVKKIKKMRVEKINIKSNSRENLVVDFLQELLYLLEVKGFLTADADLKIADNAATGAVCGDSVKNYETHGQVKAITYNDLKIQNIGQNWIIQAVVDV